MIVHSTAVRFGDRQRAGEAEADRAGLRVLAAAEAVRAAAEHLRPRLQLDVDLEPDDGLPVSSSQPLRDGVEAERALERVAGAEERVLRELRPDQLQADRQPVREAARDVQARQARPCRTGS